MTHLSDLFSPIDLQSEIASGYVKATRHPTLPLTIYTYTREAQYDGRWNDVTTKCRGLIADDHGNVIAHPLRKFYNYAEHGVRDYAPPLPIEPFRVYSKMDGSLGIIFYAFGRWMAASKGSFTSEQAQWAQRHLDDNADKLSAMNTEWTYCAEILYPENRIVVNYGDREDLVLLAVFQSDGTEIPLEQAEPTWRLGDVVQSHDGGAHATNIDRIVESTQANTHLDGTDATGTDAEGYVVRFVSGVRAKIKFSEYVRLHRILTGITERDVWRAYAFDDLVGTMTPAQLSVSLKCSETEVAMMLDAPQGAIGTIIEGCPDEFDAWVQSVILRLQKEYDSLDVAAHTAFSVISFKRGTGERGAFARELHKWYGDKKTVVSACFAMLDGKPIGGLLWRSLYPSASSPFREDTDT